MTLVTKLLNMKNDALLFIMGHGFFLFWKKYGQKY